MGSLPVGLPIFTVYFLRVAKRINDKNRFKTSSSETQVHS
jgi:hypothetical protein